MPCDARNFFRQRTRKNGGEQHQLRSVIISPRWWWWPWEDCQYRRESIPYSRLLLLQTKKMHHFLSYIMFCTVVILYRNSFDDRCSDTSSQVSNALAVYYRNIYIRNKRRSLRRILFYMRTSCDLMERHQTIIVSLFIWIKVYIFTLMTIIYPKLLETSAVDCMKFYFLHRLFLLSLLNIVYI